MRRLLVINPNTSEMVTERIVRWASTYVPPDVSVSALTARFGAPYIACEASHAVASHALLDAWSSYLTSSTERPDAVLIACFGDPGLFALREVSACPISGLAEASFLKAQAFGAFAIVTGGDRWGPMLERLAMNLGVGASGSDSLAHIEIVKQTGAELLADRALAVHVLTQACERAAASGVRAVVLGGAGLLGFAKTLQPNFEIPIIDSVQAGFDIFLEGRMPLAKQAHNAFQTSWVNLPSTMSLSA